MILNIYKPSGITSFDVIRILKKILFHPNLCVLSDEWINISKKYNKGKIGHAGTLDPFASGVLIIATDLDTKKISSIQSEPKQYKAHIKLGFTSNTYDVDGDLQSSQNITIPSLDDIKKILQSNYNGEIWQIPPSFSAKKINGQRAYALARAGISVKLSPKKVIIYNIGVNSYHYPDLKLTIDCSTGTYIRSIAHDLGKLAGCGGYCHALVRTKIGKFNLKKSIELPPEQIKYYLNKKNA